MSILKVAHMGHPVLRTKARAIDRAEIKSATVQKLIDDMIDTMQEYHGVGLAGPQVHEGLRLFVATLDRRTRRRERRRSRSRSSTPRSRRSANELVEDWEGCLSIPDIRGRVPRLREIKVRAFDRNGEQIEIRGRKFFSARHPARNRSSGRHLVLRSDEVVRVADVSRRVLAVLGEERRRGWTELRIKN